MGNTLNERVARFIARYRTVVVESSLSKIDEDIAYDEAQDPINFEEEITLLREMRLNSEIAKIPDEETRYRELVAQDVAARLLAIKGVESVDVVEIGGEALALQATIQARYLYNGISYDAGKWLWSVGMVSFDENAFNPEIHRYELHSLDDGTCFLESSVLFSGSVLQPFKTGFTDHPIYEDCEYGFCFGDSRTDIREYLLTGEFVSAFQLISLCLHHVNTVDTCYIPMYFNRLDDEKAI